LAKISHLPAYDLFGAAKPMLGQSHFLAKTLFFALVAVATFGWLYLLATLAIMLIHAI
jgi:hypothetical protein